MNEPVWMQARCVHCLGEHYGPAVVDISYGEAACHNCGKRSAPMTRDEYLEALTATRRRVGRQAAPRQRKAAD
jgi:hypothetical protein